MNGILGLKWAKFISEAKKNEPMGMEVRGKE
jgi:hypothetical protein